MRIDWKNFGIAVLYERLYHHKVSVRDFAKKLDLNKSTICRIENGKPCDAPKYLTLCKALNLDPWQFTIE